jgi:hypothetical protein
MNNVLIAVTITTDSQPSENLLRLIDVVKTATENGTIADRLSSLRQFVISGSLSEFSLNMNFAWLMIPMAPPLV